MKLWAKEGAAILEIEATIRGYTRPGNRGGHPDTWTEDEDCEDGPSLIVILNGEEVVRGSDDEIREQLPRLLELLFDAAVDAAREAVPGPDEDDGEEPDPGDVFGELLA